MNWMNAMKLTRPCGILPAALLLAAWLPVGPPLRAEVAAQPSPSTSTTGIFILGIIEGPDPIPYYQEPHLIWQTFRDDVDPELILNAQGVKDLDGRPDVAIDPLTELPHVVWAHNKGTDFDIAYSSWEQGAWSETEYLTSNALNQLDPRIFVSEQAIYVVWWEMPSATLWFSKHPRMGSWSTPEQVTAMAPAFRPTVLYWEGKLLFAAERGEGMNKDILFLTRIGPSNYTSESVAFSGSAHPLNVVLHGEQGTLWMDWCESLTLCAYSVRVNGEWSEPVDFPAVGPSWLAREQTRMLIRNQVLAGP